MELGASHRTPWGPSSARKRPMGPFDREIGRARKKDLLKEQKRREDEMRCAMVFAKDNKERDEIYDGYVPGVDFVYPG